MIDSGTPQSTTMYKALLFLLLLAITKNPSVHVGNPRGMTGSPTSGGAHKFGFAGPEILGKNQEL